MLRNVPVIRDVEVVSGLLALHGVAIDYDQAEGVLRLDPSRVECAHVADIDAHAGSSRIPILFAGRCCTAWGRPSSRTWVAAASGTVPSTSTCTS